LQLTVELADAGHEPGQVGLDLGQAEVGLGIGVGRRLGFQERRDLHQAVADGVEHGRLQADCVAERVQCGQHPGHGRFPLRRQRPLQVASLELLGRGVCGRVILGDLEQPPTHQRVQRGDQLVFADHLIPPDSPQRTLHALDVEDGCEHGGALERAHHRDMQIAPVGSGEAEEVGVEVTPGSESHETDATQPL
jgi:hypothetical protein